ncbi:hypothetical protein GCM10023091_22000 [Ravibacter arvi]|uniref:DNA-binding response regulator n=1 Tax=Ravibacter arvi TaxID=2051041 RepID=A0ABP8LXI6_9BACT
MEPIKILIIEDNLMTAADIRGYMEDAGHTVTGVARNQKEAVRLVKNDPPDLLIADITLGEVEDGGIKAVKEILDQHWAPVIYLTARTDDEMVNKGAETAPSAYLFKPFRAEELAIQVRLAYENFTGRPEPSRGETIGEDSFYFPFKTGHLRVKTDEILFLKALGYCTELHLVRQKAPQVIGTNLGKLERYFTKPNFIRLSKSLFINLDHLRQIERDCIYMGDDRVEVKISEANRRGLMKKLQIVRTRKSPGAS